MLTQYSWRHLRWADDPVSPPHFAGDLYSDIYEPGDFPGFEESDHPLSEGQISDDEDISARDDLSSDDEYKWVSKYLKVYYLQFS